MKIQIWTCWGAHDSDKPRCVYIGETDMMPRRGDQITFFENNSERVSDVNVNLVSGCIEVQIDTSDPYRKYGKSLV